MDDRVGILVIIYILRATAYSCIIRLNANAYQAESCVFALNRDIVVSFKFLISITPCVSRRQEIN